MQMGTAKIVVHDVDFERIKSVLAPLIPSSLVKTPTVGTNTRFPGIVILYYEDIFETRELIDAARQAGAIEASILISAVAPPL